jgi:DNA-binding transcriptional LysR family regulator
MTELVPDLADLQLLVVVARTGSLGRAAVELGVSQPAVSRRMARLERSLRVELLQRGHRGTALTTTGRVVVGWASALLSSASQFAESVEAMRRQRSVTLRVSASMTIAEYLAPTWLTRLRERDPDAVIALSVRNSSDVAAEVESGHADLGFVESPTVRSSLKRRRIGWDELLVLVSPDHPWARRRTPLSAATLGQEPLLVREAGSGTRETIDDALARVGLELTPSMTLASNSALKSSAMAGIGPAVLSALAVTEELRAGLLVAVDVAGLDLRRPLSVVWKEGRQLPAPAETLLRVAAIHHTPA